MALAPSPSLRTLLHRDALSAFDRRVLRAALTTHPWCWPSEPGLQARARALGIDAPSGLAVGEVLLLSYVHGEPALGGLARLTLDPAAFGAELSFERSAQDALQRAFGVVSRDLPQLVRPEALARREAWTAVLLPGGPAGLRTLVGESFGLSFALSAASLLSDVPVPADLAASATLRPDGLLGPVEGLEAKLEVVCGYALGVRRLLVAQEQADLARALARGRVEIVGCADLASALRCVFPDLEHVTPASWKTPELAIAVARQLYRLAMRPVKPLLGWKGVAHAAQALLEALPADDHVHRAQVSFARQVALRHEGAPARLEWPPDDVLMRMQAPLRLTLLAHVVQAATEVGAPDLAGTLDRARAHVPRLRDAERGGLRLMGAVGRGLARLRRLDEAAALLEEVVEAWRLALLPEDATFALCELLRVLGLRKDVAGIERLAPVIEEVLSEPLLEDVNRDFVQQALARTQLELALQGTTPLDAPELDQAIQTLDRLGDAGLSVPGHVGLASLRQLARLRAARGDMDEAQRLRARLPSERFGAYVLLGRLDAALESDVDVASALAALESSPYAHHLPKVPDGLSPTERAFIMAREFPY